MNKPLRWTLFLGLPLVLIGILFYSVHLWGLKHAQFMTGGTPHPSNCFSCHLYLDQDNKVAEMIDKSYVSPFKMKVSPDGESLFIAAQESNEFIVVDLKGGRIRSRIPVGNWPHSIDVLKDGSMAFVSNHWSDNVSVIDLSAGKVIDTLPAGSGPSGLVLDHKDEFLYVNNSFSGNVSVIDIRNKKEVRRLPSGNYPMGIAISPDGKQVTVTHRRAKPSGFRETPVTEITIIDTKNKQVVERKDINEAHILENIDYTPAGDLSLFTLIRPKNLVPSTQIERGFMITEGIGVIENREGGKIAQLLLDEPNQYFADPYDIEVSPNGRHAYVSHAGVDYVSVIDLNALRDILVSNSQEELNNLANHLGMSNRFVVKRIKTGPNPKGLAISPDGNFLYIAERYADQVSVMETRSMEIAARIDLEGPSAETLVRQGGRLFFNAGRTFQDQYSCSTCHPDGSEDGLTYDLTGTGRDLENTITLRELSNTSPFKWNGKNVSVYMQCGMRFSRYVTRTESFTPEELNALVAFIFMKLENPPNPFQLADLELTDAQKRGKAIFERTRTNDGREIPVKDRCITCHPPPYFTNRSSANVGSGFETDTEEFFDTPKLNNIVDTAPYLHDGRAQTLEEIWTVYGGKDFHGYVNDLMKMELNDLIEYLRGIGPAHTYKIEESNIKQASNE